jgi:hypothetical protein
MTKSCPSEQALHAVALDRAAELATHRDPQARVGVVIGRARKRVDDEVTARMGASLAVHAFELTAAG